MDIASGIAAAGVIISGVGLGIAFRANGLAKRSTNAAEVSAQSAAGAVAEAREANRIAEEANDKAAHANHIAEENAAIARDRSQVQWVFETDKNGLIVGVRNDSADPAQNVAVIVDCQGEREADVRTENVAGLEVVALDLTGMWEKQFDQLKRAQIKHTAMIGDQLLGTHRSIAFDIRAWVSWESAAGAPHSCVIDQKMRHRLQDGVISTNRPRRQPRPDIF